MDHNATLSIIGAADRLRVSRRTIYNYIKARKLETKRIGESQRVFCRSILALEQRWAAEERRREKMNAQRHEQDRHRKAATRPR